LFKLLQQERARTAQQNAPQQQENTGPAPLSFAQQRLWFMNRLAPGPEYNLPASVLLKGNLNREALEASLNQILERHEILRTVFREENGDPYQILSGDIASIQVEFEDLSEMSASERERASTRQQTIEAEYRFDLEKGPLWRVRLLRLNTSEHLLLLTMHHIISDEWSMEVLVREMAELYSARQQGREPSLEPLSIQYSDYARWQREWMQGQALQSELSYWRNQLHGAATLLTLPTDYPRPAIANHEGTVYSFTLPGELSRKLKELSRQEDVTLFMLLLAAFKWNLRFRTWLPARSRRSAI
jgi:NRPS condensation-like uncharacterized protein